MMISDLPMDMVEEVLCKLPMTSLRRARFTCRRWNNTLSKDWSFTRKYNGEAAKRKESQVVMVLEYKVYLMSVNLHNPSPSIEPIVLRFQLAVLFQECAPPYTLKVWISSKVCPNAKNNAVVVIDKTRGLPFTIRNMAYVLGENGYFKSVDLGDFAPMKCWPLVCSYVPSLVKF
ncbi:BnaA01g28290D [Brassica napus]|uniref:BnaA01g28290D protein n=1 Tax=Brassica napus TaxID=3708 RepID=A0A078G6B2_BRANA|nr:BnaA01g28290D [Brassica napus]